MWNYSAFAPAGVCLVGLAWWVSGAKQGLPIRRAISLGVGLWVLAWLGTLGYMALVGDGKPRTFIAQRDVGYLIGSLIFISVPFLAVLMSSMVLRQAPLNATPKVLASLGIAAVAWLFVPWLFYVGWIVGCVFAGYPSCM